MKITDVTVTIFAWDNIPPTTYGRHTGRIPSKTDIGLVTVQTDAGIEGHAFLGGVGRGGSTDAGTLIGVLKPIIMGQDPLDREKLYHATWQRGRNTTLRCLGAVDVALWDIAGKAANMPLHKLLGSYRD
ncbi:MAG: mandelate racemase, partial [Dehalococcoidia bacterium]|nr:mandelate racemase [Dehalococcoidia bacterium]